VTIATGKRQPKGKRLRLKRILDAVVLNHNIRCALRLKFPIHAVDLLEVVVLDGPVEPNRNRAGAFDGVAAIAKANALYPLLGVVEGVVFDGDAG
jgi:hypothetical protein